MKKSAQVVMLPTNEKAEIGFLTQKGKERGHLVHFDRPMPNILDSENQHLYFLSDEEIKDGEYGFCMNLFNQGHQPYQIIFKMDSEQRQAMIELGGQKNANVFKIIATTDKSIILPERFPSFTYLPQPSQSFLEKFVEEYNKGNVITEVMVEYEYDSYSTKTDGELTADFKLKINPKDNTIDINMPKDSWSREEVVELIQKYSKECTGWPWIETDEEWIEENL